MNESQRPLDEIVAELHEALEGAGDIGQESRATLESAVAEIRGALGEEGAVEGIAGSLGQRLADAVERFEGTHPRLTALVGRVADALSELGI